MTVPGFSEIKQNDTIKRTKFEISGNAVMEDYLNQQTTMTFTEDFSGYTQDIPAVVNVYLTDTATKPVAIATINVVDMPFKLVFFKTDHLGTPRMVTNHDGTVLTTHDFLAYGEELTDPDFNTNSPSGESTLRSDRMKPQQLSGCPGPPFGGFTGHERDPETGLDYMKARYYAAGFGRMLQVDPIDDYKYTDPMSFNKYSYVRGNPVMGTDPTGEFVGTITGGLVGGIIGGISNTVKGKSFWKGVASGATAGAIAGAAVDLTVATGGAGAVLIAAGVIGGATGGAAGSIVEQKLDGAEKIDTKEVLISAGAGGVGGLAGGAMTAVVKKIQGEVIEACVKSGMDDLVEATGKELSEQVQEELVEINLSLGAAAYTAADNTVLQASGSAAVAGAAEIAKHKVDKVKQDPQEDKDKQ